MEAMSRSCGSPRLTVRNLAPFVAASVLAWIAVPVGSSMNWGLYALAALLAVLAGVLCVAPLRGTPMRVREAVPSLIFLVGVALLRDSAGASTRLWECWRCCRCSTRLYTAIVDS